MKKRHNMALYRKARMEAHGQLLSASQLAILEHLWTGPSGPRTEAKEVRNDCRTNQPPRCFRDPDPLEHLIQRSTEDPPHPSSDVVQRAQAEPTRLTTDD